MRFPVTSRNSFQSNGFYKALTLHNFPLDAEVVQQISEAADTLEQGSKALAASLKKARERGETAIDAYSIVFYVRYIMRACVLSEEQASFELGMPVKERSEEVRTAHGAAKTQWSRAREAAGFEKKRGGGRKAKASDTNDTATSATKVAPIDDVDTFLASSEMVRNFLNYIHGAKDITDKDRTKLRDEVSALSIACEWALADLARTGDLPAAA